MIDFHCHLLPGLDDGAATLDESLEMARALAAFGFREVCCTPHCIKGHYEFSPVEVRAAVRALQTALDGEMIPLRLHAGMEYCLDEFFESYAANLLPLGSSRLVLCESPSQAHPGLVSHMAGLVAIQGFIPLIAHPERSAPVRDLLEMERATVATPAAETAEAAPPADAGPWWRRVLPGSAARAVAGAASGRRVSPLAPPVPELPEQTLFQANLGSFTGYYGAPVQRCAYELLQRGVYSCFGSDLHDPQAAAQYLGSAREKLDHNPVLGRLGGFRPPAGEGGAQQLAFW